VKSFLQESFCQDSVAQHSHDMQVVHNIQKEQNLLRQSLKKISNLTSSLKESFLE
jgi:hypothetical protein